MKRQPWGSFGFPFWIIREQEFFGPCRAGFLEDMTSEKETQAADRAYADAVKMLEQVTDEIEFLEPVDVRYTENFVVGEDFQYFGRIMRT